jgi:hypothetical protein
MDSEADSSVFGRSTTQNSVQGVLGRSRGAPAFTVWVHYRTARDNEDLNPRLRYCDYCVDVLAYSTSNSLNMRKHLKGKHDITVEIAPGRIQAVTLQQLQQLYL